MGKRINKMPGSHLLISILPGFKVIKLFPCSTQLSTKFIMLIKVKIVGIFTFIRVINTTSERHKARNVFSFQHFSFYEQL